MIWTNFKMATLVFFGWFVLDSIASVILSTPLEGIYYPMASGTLKSITADWTQKPWFGAPMYLAIFSGIWLFFMRQEGPRKGLRLAALMTAIAMAPFWIVSAISADMYQLEINGYWLASMIYANLSFLLYGFIGSGRSQDLNF